MGDALERVLRFLWATADDLADDVGRLSVGAALRAPSLPHFWSANCLRLEGPRPDITLADAEALAAAHVPDTDYRHVCVEDEGTAERLGAAARAEGWKVEEELLMLLRRPADRDTARATVREGTLEEILDLFDAWNDEEYAEQGPDALDVLREAGRRQFERQPWQPFVAADEDGRAVAMCSLLVRGGVAQVEDVFTRPEARGRGLGRAVTAEVVERARAGGHDLVFIVADANDWPQQLYGRLGFDALGRRATLHRV